MSASWYDVLGVAPSASVEEIRAAWRAATEDLEPTDRRFDLYNGAAKVLLDEDARAEYDAELGVSGTDPDGPEPEAPEDRAGAVVPVRTESTRTVPSPPSEPATEGSGRTGRFQRWLAALAAPLWLLVAMTLAAVVVAGGTWLLAFDSDDATADASSEARAVAEANFGNVLTYRWDDLDTAYQRATAVLTSDYRAEFDAVWELVETEAVNVKAVVRTDVVRTGVVRASADGKRVELAVVIRNSVSNSAGDQGTGYLMLGVTMVEQDGGWLIADVDGLGGDEAAEGDPGPVDGTPESPSATGTDPGATGSESPAGQQ